MNTDVNKLIDVDKQARLIIDEAQQYYDRTMSDLEAEKKKIRASYENKAKSHYDSMEADEKASVVDKVKQIEEKYAQMTAEIDATFEKEHVNWENELFKRCLEQ